MSNNEVFETIFKKVSIQIIDNNFIDMNVTKTKDGKYNYSNTIKLKELVNMLNRNIDVITDALVLNLLIEDRKSVRKILINHFESKEFIKSMLKITYSFKTVKKFEFEDLKKIYYDHMIYNMMNYSLIEKISALTPELNFKNWIIRRKKTILFGYVICLVIMMLTFYVFLMD